MLVKAAKGVILMKTPFSSDICLRLLGAEYHEERGVKYQSNFPFCLNVDG